MITVFVTALLLIAGGPPQEATARAQPNEQIQISAEELQTLVESAVGKRIRPLQREIAELRDSIRFQDVLGGIGYIFGLAGIAFYFLGIKKKAALRQDDQP